MAPFGSAIEITPYMKKAPLKSGALKD